MECYHDRRFLGDMADYVYKLSLIENNLLAIHSAMTDGGNTADSYTDALLLTEDALRDLFKAMDSRVKEEYAFRKAEVAKLETATTLKTN